MRIIIEYIIYANMRHIRVSDLDTHVTEDTGSKKAQAQIAGRAFRCRLKPRT